MATPTPSGPENIAYQGKMLEIVEQPMRIGEKSVTFEFARRAPGTRLIIPTPDGKILLTKEYRPEMQGDDYRLPGGKVFDTLAEYNEFLRTGGDIKERSQMAAAKEAKEEAGVVARELEQFAVSRCGATVEWDLYYFVVAKYESAVQSLEEGEDIAVVPVSREEARAMCLDGRIQEERSALMLLRYLER